MMHNRWTGCGIDTTCVRAWRQMQFQKELSEEEKKTQQKQGSLTSQGNQLESLGKKLKESKGKLLISQRECEKLNQKVLQLQERLVSAQGWRCPRCVMEVTRLRCCARMQKTMGKSLDARDEALIEKEKEIAALRTENTTLENFRYVLDHKLGKVVEERGAAFVFANGAICTRRCLLCTVLLSCGEVLSCGGCGV